MNSQELKEFVARDIEAMRREMTIRQQVLAYIERANTEHPEPKGLDALYDRLPAGKFTGEYNIVKKRIPPNNTGKKYKKRVKA